MKDTGFLALLMIARHHGIPADEAKLLHEFGHKLFTSDVILLAAKRLGLTAKLVKQEPERLDRVLMPTIAIDKEGKFFIAVRLGYDNGDKSKPRIVIQEPGSPDIKILDMPAFLELWSGKFIFCVSKAKYLRDLGKFDFTWFIPAIVKHRKLFAEVMVISLVLQLVSLATPLGFQVVMDKVLVNHAMKTLNVVAFALLCAMIFENILSGIRTWIFARTTSKIDVELGARLYRHLISLPIDYFQTRRVGDSVARVRELENIRSFLTNNSLTLVLDLFCSVVFAFVMFMYSFQLSMIVIASLPIYVFLAVGLTPVLRSRLMEAFYHGAVNQSFLVESISGIETVKSMAVEPRWVDKWEKQLASYVTAALNTVNISTVANICVATVSRLVTVAVLWFGAAQVVDGNLTVGQLIAFTMISSRLTDPIVRIAQLWNSFQQVGVSMERLGDILNAPGEISGSKTRIPRLNGSIEFDQVSFRYRTEAPDVIRSVNVKIEPGQVIGIVGRSGSGKSTLTKLVQRLYTPDRGRVLIDGQDIAIIDTASLRHQLGVVLQENLLFSGTIRDNIALSNPALPIETIISAATLAGAHEFICELPEGYDTRVGEHGTGLSGGQRQRIAIARTLIANPRILIFDEATSALDYESEQIIQQNMRNICEGRTVLIIAHRLSAVREANRILVMERGQIVEDGPHDQLVMKQNGIYAHLYQLQFGGTTPLQVVEPMSMKHKMEAFIILLRHYKNTFARSWKNRDQLQHNHFREQEAEFLPAALEIQEKPVSPTLRITARVLIALFIFALCWAVFAQIDIVVNATGEIKPRERTKEIASVEVASVRAVHVTEGQKVKKGDLLVELDTSATDAEHDKAEGSVTEAMLTIARSRALLVAVNNQKPPRLAPLAGIPAEKLQAAQAYLNGQYLDYMAKLQRTEGAIDRYAETLKLLTQQTADYKELAHNHDIPLHAYLEKEQAKTDLEGQLNDAKHQRAVLMTETKRMAYDSLNEANKIQGAARQDSMRNATHSRLLKLTSPVDGTVLQLTVYTVGGVVPAAQPLMKIVPKEDKIEVEAKIDNKDVGFIEVGQTAAVKIDAYEYSKYGVIPARVVRISSDAIKDEKKGLIYSVILALDKSTISVKGKVMPLNPGMSVSADIKTGSRRVIEYFLSPLIQHKRESMNER